MPILLALAAAAMPGPPPRAVMPQGDIRQLTVNPIFRNRFMCAEHPADELQFAGDAFGTDCMVFGGLTGQTGFGALYRADGRHNEDWYGWHADVLAPVAGTIAFVFENPKSNVPGTMGPPPAGTVRIRTGDGVIVTMGHLTDIRVHVGDTVSAGQVLGVDGNNGTARAPHIHIGAYVEATNEPLQIRWDLHALEKAVPLGSGG
jgi:hypothetical protein